MKNQTQLLIFNINLNSSKQINQITSFHLKNSYESPEIRVSFINIFLHFYTSRPRKKLYSTNVSVHRTELKRNKKILRDIRILSPQF